MPSFLILTCNSIYIIVKITELNKTEFNSTMACPKKKTSHRKQQQRRAKWVAQLPTLSKCPNCGESKIAHYACTECGYYNGREYAKAMPRKKQKSASQ